MRIDADELEHAVGELLPAIVLGRETAHADRLALLDAGLGLGDRQRELQPTQLVDQAGLLASTPLKTRPRAAASTLAGSSLRASETWRVKSA